MKCYEITERKMRYMNYAENTVKIYLHYIDEFVVTIDKHVSRITGRDFQEYLDNYQFSSVSQQNQVINAIKFFYDNVLNKKYKKVSFKRPKKEKKLPRVIDSHLIIEKLDSIDNIKHKAILTLVYSVGLRVSEAINLKIEDIDSTRMLVHIKNAKGRKDRIVPLSENVLSLLRDYYKKFNPTMYLFNGSNGGKYTASSCQKIYKKYIDPDTSIHTLRHSCFTSLLEKGTDLRIIQKIAGHSSSKTTEIYTHVSNRLLNKVHLPI